MSKFNLDIIYRPEKSNQFNEEEESYRDLSYKEAREKIDMYLKEAKKFDTIQIFLFPAK